MDEVFISFTLISVIYFLSSRKKSKDLGYNHSRSFIPHNVVSIASSNNTPMMTAKQYRSNHTLRHDDCMQLLLCIRTITELYINFFITTVPAIVQFPEDTYIQEGEGVLFQVKVTGVPHPNLTWYHNGVEVKKDYSMDLSEHGSLIMPSAESKHSGVYKLVVHNTAGRVEREVRLTVEEENQNIRRQAVSMAAIPVSQFGNHVERDHKRSSQGFKEEYQVAGYFAMLCNLCV